MAIFQFCTIGFYATIVLVLLAMATALYVFMFAVVMIAWDGCELCQHIKQSLVAKSTHGH